MGLKVDDHALFCIPAAVVFVGAGLLQVRHVSRLVIVGFGWGDCAIRQID